LKTFLAILTLWAGVSLTGCTTPVIAPDHKALDDSRKSIVQHIDNAQTTNTSALDYIGKALDLLNLGRPATEVKPPVVQAQVKVQESNSELIAAKAQVATLTQQQDQLEQKIAEQVANYATLQAQLSTVTKEKDSAIQKLTKEKAEVVLERDAAVKKYHDAWLGGATWRLIGWLTAGAILLTIIMLILNLHTDIFVWPLRIIGWILTPK